MDTTRTWHTQEHFHRERAADWFWALGVTAVSLAIISLLFSNVLLSLLIIVAAGTFGIIASHPPRTITCTIQNDGLSIEDEWFAFEDMRAFWVTEGDHPLLYIDTPKMFSPDVVVPLSDVTPEEIRVRFLAAHVEEREMHESFPFKVLEFLGF